ncbi:Uma2 family endonuclease [Rubrimonas cliftonensis]|uniref:Endonuclease, Uma2 family (Restriction endonuclease fold) n=1 Tax=Rubrimonas cliftonensis TaxID=89524 RepID=A0A1H3WKU2_9RHOB|nr:Uma2 family endonuclease [Rubrimonas cliftonensis]SDZ87745.1 Endonuclease, Uma2 family (restriction endonuclease fold) [Rubrimonas cliftonensis]
MNVQTPSIKRPATYQDVLDAPPNMVAELIRGALHLQPRPRPRHSRAITRLGVKLGGPFDADEGGPGGWTILIEPELHLGEEVLVPDLAGWQRERLPSLPDDVGITVGPDWVCEVLSPSTRTYDLTEKRDVYREQGVAWLWFVDPAARTLEAFALKDGAWVLIAALHDDAEVRVAPFDAVGFALGALWAD